MLRSSQAARSRQYIIEQTFPFNFSKFDISE
uniref:RecQl3 n=1 Tax=Arundo donax TaxID=35708 RepID=A0A0A9GSU2_ARUDO